MCHTELLVIFFHPYNVYGDNSLVFPEQRKPVRITHDVMGDDRAFTNTRRTLEFCECGAERRYKLSLREQK